MYLHCELAIDPPKLSLVTVTLLRLLRYHVDSIGINIKPLNAGLSPPQSRNILSWRLALLLFCDEDVSHVFAVIGMVTSCPFSHRPCMNEPLLGLFGDQLIQPVSVHHNQRKPL